MLDILQKHSDQKNFITSVFLETHQNVWMLDSLDDRFVTFMDQILRENPETAIIIMSDHGSHYGYEYQHDIGIIHSRLPFFYPILPKSLPSFG
jgi:hypothetical protein